MLSIWCCCYKDMKSQTVQCLEYFRRHTKIEYVFNILSGDALIGRSRSIAATQFIKKSPHSYMLFIDDDVTFLPSDVETIYNNMKEGYEVIGGFYSTKDGTQLAQSNINSDIIFDGKIHEIDFAATGFMGISKNALKSIIRKCNLPLLHENEWGENYPFFESGKYLKESIYISEDWDFCNKVRASGFKVYMNSSVQIGHVGEKTYRIQDVKEYLTKQERVVE